jgi:hypothetical protein
MNTALKALVSTFSFAFTFVLVFGLFSTLISPFADLLDQTHHPVLAASLDFMPVLIALPAAFEAARTGYRLESERQRRRSARPKKQHPL